MCAYLNHIMYPNHTYFLVLRVLPHPTPRTCQEKGADTESWGWEPREGRGEKEAHGCHYLIIPSLEDGETEAVRK